MQHLKCFGHVLKVFLQGIGILFQLFHLPLRLRDRFVDLCLHNVEVVCCLGDVMKTIFQGIHLALGTDHIIFQLRETLGCVPHFLGRQKNVLRQFVHNPVCAGQCIIQRMLVKIRLSFHRHDGYGVLLCVFVSAVSK